MTSVNLELMHRHSTVRKVGQTSPSEVVKMDVREADLLMPTDLDLSASNT